METVEHVQILEIILKVGPMKCPDGLDLGHKMKESGMTGLWNLHSLLPKTTNSPVLCMKNKGKEWKEEMSLAF